MIFSINSCSKLLVRASLASFCFISASAVWANDTDIKFAGFASLAYAKTIGSNRDGPINKITSEGEYRDFNTVGFRMDADLKDNLAFTAQLAAYGREDYDPTFDWIFVNVGITPELRLEVGKTRIPLYMYSDFIDVGYAYQWIEPPSTVYSNNFLRTLEGLKLAYTTNIGDWASELLVFGGTDEEHFKSDDTGDAIDLTVEGGAGLAWTVDYEWLSLRAVYMQGDLSIAGFSGIDKLSQGISGLGRGINGLIQSGALDQVGLAPVNTVAIEQAIALDKDKLKYYALGASLDFGSVFTVLELKQSLFDTSIAVNDNIGGYLTFGVRLPEKVTLSVNYGQTKMDGDKDIVDAYQAIFANMPVLSSSVPDPTLQGTIKSINDAIQGAAATPTSPQQAPMSAILNAAVELAQNKTIDEYSMQVRWDFHPSAAFKFEYLLQDNHQISATTFQPEHVRPQAYMVGIDLVF